MDILGHKRGPGGRPRSGYATERASVHEKPTLDHLSLLFSFPKSQNLRPKPVSFLVSGLDDCISSLHSPVGSSSQDSSLGRAWPVDPEAVDGGTCSHRPPVNLATAGRNPRRIAAYHISEPVYSVPPKRHTGTTFNCWSPTFQATLPDGIPNVSPLRPRAS